MRLPETLPPDLKKNSRGQQSIRAKWAALDTTRMVLTRQTLPPQDQSHLAICFQPGLGAHHYLRRALVTLEVLVLLFELHWPDGRWHLEAPSLHLPLLKTRTRRPL